MKLTNFTDYSLRTLMHLCSCKNNFSTAKEISEFFNISQNHMVKVVHSLSKNGYIISKKGNGGGISLAKNAHEIVIGDVIRDVEINFDIVECFKSQKNQCIISPTCSLKGVLFNAKQAFMNEVNKYTLADLVKA
jgi:Rrf2 family transcriptional regulator, nitric oxide-sensitive transcriptional repressor